MFLSLLQKNAAIKATHAVCPSCDEKTEIELWDKQTKAFLGDEIPSIKDATKTNIPYQCPGCYTGHLSKSVKLV
jgi:hypothetical protein